MSYKDASLHRLEKDLDYFKQHHGTASIVSEIECLIAVRRQEKANKTAALYENIKDDTGKSIGDFGGEFGLLEWLVAEGYQDHAKLLIENSDNDLSVILL